jgi:hypothetical protein
MCLTLPSLGNTSCSEFDISFIAKISNPIYLSFILAVGPGLGCGFRPWDGAQQLIRRLQHAQLGWIPASAANA